MSATTIYKGGQISPTGHVQKLAVWVGVSGDTYGTGITVTLPDMKNIVGAVVSSTLNTTSEAYYPVISSISGQDVVVKLYGSNNAEDNAALTECAGAETMEDLTLYVIVYGK